MSDVAKLKGTAWAPAVASIFLAMLQWPLLDIYAWVHWGALYKSGYELPAVFRPPLLNVLSALDVWRIVVGVVALGFGAWAVTLRPRWVGAIALVGGLVSAFVGVAIRM
jgi:hypothetical protein